MNKCDDHTILILSPIQIHPWSRLWSLRKVLLLLGKCNRRWKNEDGLKFLERFTLFCYLSSWKRTESSYWSINKFILSHYWYNLDKTSFSFFLWPDGRTHILKRTEKYISSSKYLLLLLNPSDRNKLNCNWFAFAPMFLSDLQLFRCLTLFE